MKKLLLLVMSFCVIGCEDPPVRHFTVTAISQKGDVIGKWEHVRLWGKGGGWCEFRLQTEKLVRVDGPYILVEE
jgi:hypothetical protein